MTDTLNNPLNDLDDSKDTDVPSRSPTPGELLKQARLESALTPSDIAQKLHISTQMVLALEENNYQHISATIYLKGYLKHYAQVVDLSVDSVMAAFQELNWEPVVSESKVQHSKLPKYLNAKSQPRKKKRALKLSLLLVVLMLAVFVYFSFIHRSAGDLLSGTSHRAVQTGQDVALAISTAKPDATQ